MNEQKKKEVLGHSLQILIGILIIIPFFNTTSWMRFIALAGFLLIIYNIIWFVRNSEEILYDLFPTKYIREKKPSFKDKIWQHISGLLFIGGLVFLIFQMDTIENIIEESKFWKTFALIGFGIALVSLFFIRLIRPSAFHESGRRYTLIFGFVLGCMTFTSASASYINQYYAASHLSKSNFIVDHKVAGGKRGKIYWVFIEIDNSMKRFKLNFKQWSSIHEGQKVELHIKNGFLDYNFLEHIGHIEKY